MTQEELKTSQMPIILSLARDVLRQTEEITKYLEANDLPTPSSGLTYSGPPETAQYQALYDVLKASLEDLTHLVDGPKRFWRQLCGLSWDFSAFQVALDSGFSTLVPADGAISIQALAAKANIDIDRISITDRAFASAIVCHEDARAWQTEWQTAAHLVASRIDAIWSAASRPPELMSEATTVSVLSQRAAYQLFSNMVDYDVRYRGMRRVALVEGALEAAADVVLGADRHGTWHTPPHWIDGAFQLAGFVMNSFGVQGGNGPAAGSSRDCFYITPGWRDLRLAEPLEPGPEVQYRNYVRMVPVDGEAGAYSGDIYLLRGARVVGVCAGIKFKRVPRAMMPIMFPRHEEKMKRYASQFPLNSQSRPVDTKLIVTNQQTVASKADHITTSPPSQDTPSSTPKASQDGRSPNVAACIQLIANETGLDMEDVSGKAAFVELGVDSLMSLTLAERIQAELGIQVKASIFLECATVQDLENWLMKQSS